MFFWIYMFLMTLLVPLCMICFGYHFSKNPPEKINPVFGYRTKISMLNQDTWIFAHQHYGKISKLVGWILLALTVPSMFLFLHASTSTVGIVGIIVVGVQIGALIGSIFPTQKALKETFDATGNRKL